MLPRDAALLRDALLLRAAVVLALPSAELAVLVLSSAIGFSFLPPGTAKASHGSAPHGSEPHAHPARKQGRGACSAALASSPAPVTCRNSCR
ncbi:hypothetical protein MPL1032_250019 [Mesorhizobium plurifarium]|uniref:Uncharacterized protein n=1 Tax=Mesorhizobium plurifarium TaxID=69974 RepID=A0A0K2W162_MESPL|nr:hypothetical protein MPL1032_250019 [Mesorhizobium plurifarium]